MTTWLKIKLLISHIACLLVGIFIVLGWQHMEQEQRQKNYQKPTPDMIASFLTSRLHLTPDQVAKVKPIIVQLGTKLEQQRTSNEQQAEVIVDDSDSQISSLLTPDQQTEWKKVIEERKGWHHHHHMDF